MKLSKLERKARSLRTSWARLGHKIPIGSLREMLSDTTWMLGVCPYCFIDLSIKTLSIDHKLPKSRGGTNKKSNLVYCHLGCNKAKGDLTVEEYLGLKSYCETAGIWPNVFKRLKASGFMYQ